MIVVKRPTIFTMIAAGLLSGIISLQARPALSQTGMAFQTSTSAIHKAARILEGPDSDAVYMQLQAGKPIIRKVTRANRYADPGDIAVQMEGFSLSMSPGEPMLPYQLYQFALPPDVVLDSLKFKITRRVEDEMPQSYQVAPAPPRGRCQAETAEKEKISEVEKWGEGKNIVNGKNLLVYEKDVLYPVDICFVGYGGQIRKWKVGTVTFYPVRYNPVKKKLFLTKQVDLKITFKRDSALLERPGAKALLRDRVFDERARQLFLNFDRATHWYQKPLLKELNRHNDQGDNSSGPEVKDPDYAIITTEATFTNNINAGGSIDDFCFHKENLGFEVMVITQHATRLVEHDPATGFSFSTIAGAGGYEDVVGAPAPNQRPDKIYKWLKDNYLVYGIEYVLLIGNPDPDNLPAGDVVGDLPMKNLLLSVNNDVPTDFYFAELTGNWDLDGDGNAGEFVDDKGAGGVEFYADVIVGRIPCYDEDGDGRLDYNEMNAILDNIITYENIAAGTAPWRRHVLTSCPYVVDTDMDGIKDTAKYEWSEVLKDEVAPTPLWDWYRIYEEPYPGLTAPAEVDTGCTTAQTQAGWNDPGDPNDGQGSVMWMTHGGQTSATRVFNNARCANLDPTKPSIVFMGACHNGEPRFNPPAGIPLGYANLKQGAIATISASRDSYG